MKRQTGKNKFFQHLTQILVYALLGGIIGALVSCIQNSALILEFLIDGFIHGLIIGFLLAYYILMIFRPWIRPATRKIPSIVIIILNSIVFLFLILLGRAIGIMITSESHSFSLIGKDQLFSGAVIIAFIILLVINFFIHITPLFGQEAMVNFIFGRYRKYKEEDRMIMFLDITSSTKITEKIGNVLYLQLLDQFFYLMTEPLLESNGLIYKYIGDEAIITWKTKDVNAENGMKFFFDFKKVINDHKDGFQQKFGLVPQFRAGLHKGKIIMGEMGDVKKEIVMLGDALNTTAHMISLGKKEKEELVISSTLMDTKKMASSLYRFQNLGTHQLKGKQQELNLYGVSEASSDALPPNFNLPESFKDSPTKQ